MRITAKTLTALLLFALPLAAQTFLDRQEDRIHVFVDGVRLTTVHFAPQLRKPFLHPLIASDGTRLTRRFPFELVEGETQDHPHHTGVWYAYGAVNGLDYWNEKPDGGKHRLAGPPKIEGNSVALEALLLSPEGKPTGTIAQRFAFSSDGPVRFIDVAVEWRADQGADIALGDIEEGALGIRLRDEYRQDRGSTLVNSDGLQGTENIWGKRALWTDYSTELDGRTYGVAMFDHPSNPRHPTWWHARGYGLNAANPFAIHDFTGDGDGSMTLRQGETLAFRYRIVIHPGGADSIDALYQDWAKQP